MSFSIFSYISSDKYGQTNDGLRDNMCVNGNTVDKALWKNNDKIIYETFEISKVEGLTPIEVKTMSKYLTALFSNVAKNDMDFKAIKEAFVPLIDMCNSRRFILLYKFGLAIVRCYQDSRQKLQDSKVQKKWIATFLPELNAEDVRLMQVNHHVVANNIVEMYYQLTTSLQVLYATRAEMLGGNEAQEEKGFVKKAIRYVTNTIIGDVGEMFSEKFSSFADTIKGVVNTGVQVVKQLTSAMVQGLLAAVAVLVLVKCNNSYVRVVSALFATFFGVSSLLDATVVLVHYLHLIKDKEQCVCFSCEEFRIKHGETKVRDGDVHNCSNFDRLKNTVSEGDGPCVDFVTTMWKCMKSVFECQDVKTIKENNVYMSRVVNTFKFAKTMSGFVDFLKNVVLNGFYWIYEKYYGVPYAVGDDVVLIENHSKLLDRYLELTKDFDMSVDSKREAIKELYMDALKISGDALHLSLKSRPIPIVTYCMGIYNQISTKYNEIRRFENSDKDRPIPVTLYLFGAAGAGKSSLIEFITSDIGRLLYPQIEKMNILKYSRQPDSEYWQGYCGQKFFIMDDIFQSDSVEDNRKEIMDLISCYNVSDFWLNMADIENKGAIKFTSEFVIMTSNVNATGTGSGIKCPGAFLRRRDLVFEVQRLGSNMSTLHRGGWNFFLKNQIGDVMYNTYAEYLKARYGESCKYISDFIKENQWVKQKVYTYSEVVKLVLLQREMNERFKVGNKIPDGQEKVVKELEDFVKLISTKAEMEQNGDSMDSVELRSAKEELSSEDIPLIPTPEKQD